MYQPKDDEILIPREVTIAVRWTIVGALAILLLSMASGKSGVANYLELERRAEALNKVIVNLQSTNQLMQQEIEMLQNNKNEQIRFLRNEFGVIAESESIVRFENLEKTRKIAQAANNTSFKN